MVINHSGSCHGGWGLATENLEGGMERGNRPEACGVVGNPVGPQLGAG